ncbi:MAG: hypothetical protein DRJ61_11655 [Acidobacteria bacterium]|nr:MAG: hypothetical protein DRJ61_11655 [Acidobacteriota bacterium]
MDLVHRTFRRHGIWHALTYGTLLGAVRDGQLIPWDDDIDLMVRPSDIDRILRLNNILANESIVFHSITHAPTMLAVNPGAVCGFSPCQLAISFAGRKIGDLYAFNLFSDGILRRFDPKTNAYWCPHSSFPHYFVEETTIVSVGGNEYPAPRRPDRFLSGVYGNDWREPYRAVRQGGDAQEGRTAHGDRYEPKLAEEIQWCIDQGWDRTRYRNELRWPRTIAGAGPVGPSERTADSSQALWWRTTDELIEHF